MIKGYALIDGKPVEADGAQCRVWAYADPTADEKAALISSYGIDEHTLASALGPRRTRPRGV